MHTTTTLDRLAPCSAPAIYEFRTSSELYILVWHFAVANKGELHTTYECIGEISNDIGSWLTVLRSYVFEMLTRPCIQFNSIQFNILYCLQPFATCTPYIAYVHMYPGRQALQSYVSEIASNSFMETHLDARSAAKDYDHVCTEMNSSGRPIDFSTWSISTRITPWLISYRLLTLITILQAYYIRLMHARTHARTHHKHIAAIAMHNVHCFLVEKFYLEAIIIICIANSPCRTAAALEHIFVLYILIYIYIYI